jgi:hypothetical protein
VTHGFWASLKDLRYKLPSLHDEWVITDGWGDDLGMFWQVLNSWASPILRDP